MFLDVPGKKKGKTNPCYYYLDIGNVGSSDIMTTTTPDPEGESLCIHIEGFGELGFEIRSAIVFGYCCSIRIYLACTHARTHEHLIFYDPIR